MLYTTNFSNSGSRVSYIPVDISPPVLFTLRLLDVLHYVSVQQLAAASTGYAKGLLLTVLVVNNFSSTLFWDWGGHESPT